MITDIREKLQADLGKAFRILSEVGGGGMSRIFLAWETGLARWVVLKLLPPELTAPVSVNRFFREIRIAAGLQHPHIVPVLNGGQASGLLYYTMPLVEGEPLRDVLARERQIPIPACVHLLRDLADALSYAHRRGVIHLDVKPENILLTGRHALVTDFGIAKAISMPGVAGRTSLTSVEHVLGTPAYMAPEQIAADPNIDHRADLYALGVVAYEVLAGEAPFGSTSQQALLAAHLVEAPKPIANRCPDVPVPLATLVMRLLEKRPADRPDSADDVMRELDAISSPGWSWAR